MLSKKVIKDIEDKILLIDEINNEYGYINTIPAGINRFKCVCPFHSDSDPSLVIYCDTNSYYCFGCKKWGGVIKWTMDIRKVSFNNAIEYLATKYKILTNVDAFNFDIKNIDEIYNLLEQDKIFMTNYHISKRIKTYLKMINYDNDELKIAELFLKKFDNNMVKKNIEEIYKTKDEIDNYYINKKIKNYGGKYEFNT